MLAEVKGDLITPAALSTNIPRLTQDVGFVRS